MVLYALLCLAACGRWFVTWHGFIAVIAVYSCLVTPIELAFFDEEGAPWELLAMDFTTNSLFLLDLLLTFRVIYRDNKTLQWVYQRDKIAFR